MKFLKSQLFIFDLIFAVVIIVISLGLIFSYYTNTKGNTDLFGLNLEIMNGFTQTKINDLNDDSIRKMFVNGDIKNIENTVSQQVSEFYYNGDISLAKNLSKIFLEDYVTKQMNLNVTIDNGSGTEYEIYSKINVNDISFDDASISSSLQRSIYGFINKTDYFGSPYIFRIKLWS